MKWKSTFVFSFLAQILGILGFSFATPFLPFFIGELGVDDPGRRALWAGIALSSAGLTFALFAPVWGALADRYGRKPMVCRAMFGGSVALLLMSFAKTLPQLVAFRFFQGMFSGTLAASIALVASVVPQHRSGVTLGMMQAAVFIGNGVGPFIGGLAADAFGYRASFRVGAVLTLLGGLLVLFGTREDFVPRTTKQRQGNPGFLAILLLPGFAISVIVMFGVRLSNSINNPSFPLIIESIVGKVPNLNSIAGGIIATAAIAAAVSSGLLGYVGDRIGRRPILIACCLGTSLACVGQFLAYSLGSLALARLLFGFTVAGMLPAANAMIHSIVDKQSIGKAYGLATSLSMLGTAAGPSIGGYLAMSQGLRVPFLVTASAQIALATMVFFCLRERRVAGLPPERRRTRRAGPDGPKGADSP